MGTGVVITGVGVVSPVGIGRESYWKALCEGRTGFRPITLFDTAPFGVRIGGEVIDFDPLALLGKKGLRDLDRSTRLVCSAAKLALEDSNLEITPQNTGAIGVSIGTTYGSLHSISQFDRSGLVEGPRAVNPSHFPNTVINSPASQVSIRFTIKGFNSTLSTGFCAGLDAAAYGTDFIRLGRAAAVLAGGVEELCEETFRLFHGSGLLCGSDESEPVCCPFDRRRSGVVLSEGAAVLVLEHEEHALRRGARALARIAGYGSAFDPDAAPRGKSAGTGLKDAILLAMRSAGVGPDAVDAVCSCANSSRGLDRMETAVLKEALGARARRIPVSGVKSMIGETCSASGALALAAAVVELQAQTALPTMQYEVPDPACDLDYVPNASRRTEIRNVLVVAADPYGQNSAMILERP